MTSRLRTAAILAVLLFSVRATSAQVSTPGPGTFREGYAAVPGARLFYVDTGGDGIPVVFLHAATGTTRA